MSKPLLYKLRMLLYNFKRGRYGNDFLNFTLLIISLIFWMINIFLQNVALSFLINCLLIYCTYRSLSKNIWTRQKENNRFLEATKDIRTNYKVVKMNFYDKKSKYFICPNCKQIVKVPKGKGKIEISCPRCRNKFDRKS